ncbi:Lacal_2735 family protein [Aureisphaera sp. CAU 1614]|uniref:Lacal_2735 family protein n=1 Tax=Halomarinibacterium sedimenti TaxID=2857106 RepID=A0A9X1FNH4_9FLAO|nr:Lacal_2735 family protein [Halomarinibacterium sedimenti]MBW2937605.1 Lacal_2735 family protein [Halomarinibacterium sedimenti]
MFKLFKGKSEIEKLQKKYESLMSDWHKLSTNNRVESDKKYAEAQKILEQIENLQKYE